MTSENPPSGEAAAASPRVFFGLCLLAGLTMLSYGVAGAAGQSLFLTAYGSSALPAVWLAVAAASACSVMLLNHFAQRRDVVTLFVASSHVSSATLVVLMLAHLAGIPGTLFAIYVWKDIYIVVLVELFWTFANVAFGVRTASRTYGLYCAAGSVGTIAGSLAMKPMVVLMGTFHTLWTVLPALAAAAWGCKKMARGLSLPAPAPRGTPQAPSLRGGWAVLRDSRYLGLMLVVVAIVQAVVTLTDFQFNEVIEATYTDPDARTGVFGVVNAVVSAGSLVLQLGTGLILNSVGMRATWLGIPLVIGASLAAFVASPSLTTMAIAKVVGKCADYSLFRAAKEILYIPLSYAEKTQGKALVDMLTYRVAKGFVSLLLLGLAGLGLQRYVGTLNTGLCGIWLGLSVLIVRRYRALRLATDDRA